MIDNIVDEGKEANNEVRLDDMMIWQIVHTLRAIFAIHSDLVLMAFINQKQEKDKNVENKVKTILRIVF